MFSLAERMGVTFALAKVTENYDLVLLDFVGGGFRVDSYFGRPSLSTLLRCIWSGHGCVLRPPA
jgi:hypothetical protein